MTSVLQQKESRQSIENGVLYFEDGVHVRMRGSGWAGKYQEAGLYIFSATFYYIYSELGNSRQCVFYGNLPPLVNIHYHMMSYLH